MNASKLFFCDPYAVETTQSAIISDKQFQKALDFMKSGKIMNVLNFSTAQEAIKRANTTVYGLAAGVFCNDVSTVLTIVNALQAGSVWVNCYEYVSP